MKTNLQVLKDFLLSHDLKQGNTFSPWHREPMGSYFMELKKNVPSGFYSLNGVLYSVKYTNGSNGRGGMDQGTPPTVVINIIKTITSLDNVK